MNSNNESLFENLDLQQKFVDPNKQPKSIRNFFQAESEFLEKNIPNNSIVLDAGCGWGRHLFLIAKKIKKGIGIDINQKEIERSKKFLSGLKNIQVVYGNIYDIPFPDKYFDTVICMNNTLGNLSDHRLAVKEMIRVSNKQVTLSVHSDKMAKDKINWYSTLGLTNPRIEKGAIVTDEGFFSFCFTKKYLEKLFSLFPIKFKIRNLTSKSFVCILEKR